MGLYNDNITGYCYTIGEDKKYKVFDYTKNEIIAGKLIKLLKISCYTLDITLGSSALCVLYVDKENKRSFVTNKTGQVFIHDISTVILILNIYSYHVLND